MINMINKNYLFGTVVTIIATYGYYHFYSRKKKYRIYDENISNKQENIGRQQENISGEQENISGEQENISGEQENISGEQENISELQENQDSEENIIQKINELKAEINECNKKIIENEKNLKLNQEIYDVSSKTEFDEIQLDNNISVYKKKSKKYNDIIENNKKIIENLELKIE